MKRGNEREIEIAEVAAEAVADAVAPSATLVIGDRTGIVPGAARWNRLRVDGGGGTIEPPPGPFDAAVMRLPGGRAALEMTLHLTASRLSAGAPVWIYGAGDEGVASVGGRLEGLFDGVETVSIKRRSRVVRAIRTDVPARGELSDWRSVGPDGWITYPGLFNEGRIDPGTELLLSVLPEINPLWRVMDFACGAGAIARAVRAASGAVKLVALDNDPLAIAATNENVSGCETIVSDGFAEVSTAHRFNLILSNPPLHVGRMEDRSILEALVKEAPRRLTARGALIAVVQRTIGAGKLFDAGFRHVEKLAETTRFQVWRGANG